MLAVIDAGAMAQTARHRARVDKLSAISGRRRDCKSSRGRATPYLARSVHAVEYGYAARQRIALPERQLGLFQAREIADIDSRLDSAARAIEACAKCVAPTVAFHAQEDDEVPPLLDGVRIGIARDAAFSFIYPANLDMLDKLGAESVFFSPLEHTAIPAVDSLWFPGGYPELHLDRLASNAR